ncbi:MAG: hypothetical protein QOG04_451 [Actinomycetota bacterium]|jgi:hypothetical protein|nr:hypothetical protein [Actinomycetota bacterium]
MVSAHTVNIAGGIEPELLLFGLAVLFLAVLFRPSQTGTRQQFIVCLLGGVVLIASSFVVPRATAAPLPGAPECPIFPADNQWNLPVDDLPVLGNSDAIVRSIGLSTGLHPDFGSGRYQGARIGIPFVTVPGDQKKVPVRFRYAGESDDGPYPIPKDAPIEGGRGSDGDRHVIVVDKAACKLYELFAAYPRDGGASWRAGSGATWDLNSNHLRPKGWTSADAAGLPILAGLVRYNEVADGVIDHALRFTVSETRRAFIYPARHYASDLTRRSLPAMGQRLRLKQGFDISGFPAQVQVILKALKRYGMIVADNGSDWYISGAPNGGWNNSALHRLGEVHGRDFEVVDTSELPRP